MFQEPHASLTFHKIPDFSLIYLIPLQLFQTTSHHMSHMPKGNYNSIIIITTTRPILVFF